MEPHNCASCSYHGRVYDQWPCKTCQNRQKGEDNWVTNKECAYCDNYSPEHFGLNQTCKLCVRNPMYGDKWRGMPH